MSIAVAVPGAKVTDESRRIRVMVVDDAVVVRGLLSRWVEAEPGLELVGSLRSGREAIDRLEQANPDVVILDVDMPDIDGITALPRLLEKKRDLVVIMASTLTRRNAEVSLRALSLGAADYIPKPDTTREVTTSATFRQELIDKIRALGSHRKRRSSVVGRAPIPAAPESPVRPVAPAEGVVPTHVAPLAPTHPADETPVKLRPFPLLPPRALLIGSSTGGPQALKSLVCAITSVVDNAPVLVTQHMPPTFTTILAEHLARAANRPAREAVDGESIRPGNIYVAPGGRHMRVVRRDGTPVIELNDGPMINFCKPAVDPLFTSAAEMWGNAALAVVLTGMGADGTHGAADIVQAGGSVIAQDEATSVVWGMPGSVAHAGLCSAVLPLDQIGPKVVRLFAGGRQ
jgi:two-component system chemotaxis response regulator CheB